MTEARGGGIEHSKVDPQSPSVQVEALTVPVADDLEHRRVPADARVQSGQQQVQAAVGQGASPRGPGGIEGGCDAARGP